MLISICVTVTARIPRVVEHAPLRSARFLKFVQNLLSCVDICLRLENQVKKK